MLKEDFIKNTPLFAELSEDEQRAIGNRMRLENYHPAEVLYTRGGESEALYLVKEGWIKLSSDDSGTVVASLGPGSLVGEVDFFQGRPHTTTASASGQVSVWVLDNKAMAEIIREQPEIGLHLGLAFGASIIHFQPRLIARLAENSLFQSLSDRERSVIAKYLTPQSFSPSETIYRSGESPVGLFLVETGAIRLLGDTEEDYTELMAGEAFGEMAVISGKSHSNTAQAASETILWQLTPADFASLTETYPSIKTTLSRNLRSSLTVADQAYAAKVLKRIPLFKDLTEEAVRDTARLLLLRHVPAGEIIFSQGDSGDAMYVVDSGRIDAVSDEAGKRGELVARFGEGDFFGETALLTGKTRPFTAYARSDVNLWSLYRTDFDNLLIKYPQLSVALSRALLDRLGSSEDYAIEPHLKKIALLSGLSRSQLDEFSARLQPRRYQAGSSICYEGRSSNEMYFIEKGQVEHWANTVQGPLLLETLEQGDFFGEMALLSGKGHLGSAYAQVDTYIWVLTKGDFDDFVARYPSLGITFSRLLSERLEETMNRLRGAPQRGLPASTGPASRPIHVSGPHQAYRSPQPPVPPMGPSRGGSAPPVRVRPVMPPGSRSMRPALAPGPVQPPYGSRPVQPVRALPPRVYPTQGMPPVPPRPQSVPPVHSLHTQGVTPVRPGPSQPTMGMPVRPPAEVKRPKDNKRSRKVKKQQSRPVSSDRRSAKSGPQKARLQPAAPLKQLGPGPSGAETGQSALAEVRTSPPSRAALAQPRVSSNRKIQRFNTSGFSVWFANLTWGAKLRLLFILLVIIWLCGIMAPSMIIQALAASFDDGGALPGDRRSVFNQVREGGAVAAVGMLPFVETATPTPSITPTPTETPTAVPTATDTPIPTWTHTPTHTPTPTNTPTPADTPTPTSTPTRRVVVAMRPADTPTPEATPTPAVDFVLKSVRQLTACENRGKHHIFVSVVDSSGQGINGVPVKIQWAPIADGFVIAKTETKQNLKGQLEPGRIDFAMFKGTYTVEVQGGTSQIASGITPDYGTNESCGDDVQANSLFHLSFEVIFQRTF